MIVQSFLPFILHTIHARPVLTFHSGSSSGPIQPVEAALIDVRAKHIDLSGLSALNCSVSEEEVANPTSVRSV